MKLKLTWLLTLFMAFVMQFSFAQEKTITGTITSSEDGLPLPGANVVVKNTTRGAQADFDGNYSIKASEGEILVFSFSGMMSTEKTVGAGNTIDVALNTNALDEIVIIGYAGATNSSKIASAIATVDSESIEQVPIASLDQLLQGNAAGVSVSAGTGQPGSSGTIIIRGRASLSGDIEPLFIIDGIPVDQDNFRSLNTNDIESLSVLKDAAATSIYGNRGSGGVILVTTKKGKKGQGLKVQYRTLYGVTAAPELRFDVMSSFQFLTFQKNLLPGTQFGDTLSDAEINALSSQTNTDWSDIFYNQGTTLSHEISFTNGSDRHTSFTSINYYEQEGTTLGSNLQRFSFRNNYSGTSKNDRLNFSTTLSLNYSISDFIVDAQRLGGPFSGDNTGGQLDNPFIVPYIGLPYLSPFNPDGSLNIRGTFLSGALNQDGTDNINGLTGFLNTPFISLNTARLNTDEEREIKILGGINLNYNLVDHWTVGMQFGLDYQSFDNLRIIDPSSLRGGDAPTQAALNKGIHEETRFTRANFTSLAKLNYENQFFSDKLDLSATVYGEYIYENDQISGFQAFGLNPALVGSGNAITPGDVTEGDDNDIYNYIPNVSSTETELALASVFSTLELDWDNRYGFSGSVRVDKTSRFPNNSTGTFWSVAGRWNIDNENFMDNVDWLTTLKFRVSYGTVGNQNVGSRYEGLQSVDAGTGYQLANQLSLGTLRDADDIKWETTNKFNVGFSFGFWQNRLSGEFDFYNDITTDLFAPKLLSPSGTGNTLVNANVGELSNTGVDLQISYDILRKSQTNDWSINIYGNFNYNKNEITELPGGFTGNTLRNAEGRPARSWFQTRWAGVDPSNGQPLYLDVNGDITSTFRVSDAVYLDKSADPTYTGGFGANISYKGFSLSSLFSFQADVYRQNSSLAIIEDAGLAGFANQSTTLLNAWTTPGQITDIPSLSFGGLRAIDGDRYIEDASYLRLRNITLAYQVDKELLAKTNFFTGIRIYAQGTNLVTWTEWRGFDPEGNNATEFFNFPSARTFTFGVDLNF